MATGLRPMLAVSGRLPPARGGRRLVLRAEVGRRTDARPRRTVIGAPDRTLGHRCDDRLPGARRTLVRTRRADRRTRWRGRRPRARRRFRLRRPRAPDACPVGRPGSRAGGAGARDVHRLRRPPPRRTFDHRIALPCSGGRWSRTWSHTGPHWQVSARLHRRWYRSAGGKPADGGRRHPRQAARLAVPAGAAVDRVGEGEEPADAGGGDRWVHRRGGPPGVDVRRVAARRVRPRCSRVCGQCGHRLRRPDAEPPDRSVAEPPPDRSPVRGPGRPAARTRCAMGPAELVGGGRVRAMDLRRPDAAPGLARAATGQAAREVVREN